jgi:hypothetical protein
MIANIFLKQIIIKEFSKIRTFEANPRTNTWKFLCIPNTVIFLFFEINDSSEIHLLYGIFKGEGSKFKMLNKVYIYTVQKFYINIARANF